MGTNTAIVLRHCQFFVFEFDVLLVFEGFRTVSRILDSFPIKNWPSLNSNLQVSKTSFKPLVSEWIEQNYFLEYGILFWSVIVSLLKRLLSGSSTLNFLKFLSRGNLKEAIFGAGLFCLPLLERQKSFDFCLDLYLLTFLLLASWYFRCLF